MTKVRTAYGRRSLQKLSEELTSEENKDVDALMHSLHSLMDLMHNPEKVSEGIRIGIVSKLTAILKHENDELRRYASHILQIIAGHAVGRRALISSGTIDQLIALFDDSVPVVRQNTHLALKMEASSSEGAKAIVKSDFTGKIVKCLGKEDIELQVIILDTLNSCITSDPEPALREGAMKILTDLLESNCEEIKEKAADCITGLCVSFRGKSEACSIGAIPKLVALLSTTDPGVRAAAAGTLMSITIINEGKSQALETECAPALTAMVSEEDHLSKLNAIKAITNLAEHPRGRMLFGHLVQPLTELIVSKQAEESQDRYSDEVMLSRAAQIATDVICWRP